MYLAEKHISSNPRMEILHPIDRLLLYNRFQLKVHVVRVCVYCPRMMIERARILIDVPCLSATQITECCIEEMTGIVSMLRIFINILLKIGWIDFIELDEELEDWDLGCGCTLPVSVCC